jgi:hypothetical protein
MSQNSAKTPRRSGAITITTWLLLGQSLALLLMGIVNFLILGVGTTLTAEEALGVLVQELTGSVLFIALACIGLVATLNFWRLDQIAWTMGMLAQGLLLLTALILYFEEGANPYVYIMMVYGIVMVIDLHLPDVIGAFTQTSNEEGQ